MKESAPKKVTLNPRGSSPLLAEPGPRRAEERDYESGFVNVRHQRESGLGQRNLVAGVVLFTLAALLLAWALHLAGAIAIFILGACLVTAILLHVAARARLLRQRNGGFLVWGGICLLGVSLVLLQQAYLQVTGRRPSAEASTSPLAAASAKPAAPAGSEVPWLRAAFNVPPVDPMAIPAVRVARDLTVVVEGKSYRVKAGELYPLADVGIGLVTFLAGEHEVSIPSNAGEIAGGEKALEVDKLAPSTPPALPSAKDDPTAPAANRAGGFHGKNDKPEPALSGGTPAVITLQAQREAIRRYPALAVKDSPQNQLYRTAVQEQRLSGATGFFADPSWPLVLAESLATTEGWQRADAATPEGAAAPAGEPPATP